MSMAKLVAPEITVLRVGTTHSAVATLTVGEDTYWANGVAVKHPNDADNPTVGRRLAAARALSALAQEIESDVLAATAGA